MQGVEDALRRLDGVERFHVDLQHNLVEVALRPERAFDLTAIPRAVHAAGFRPGWMWVRFAAGSGQPLQRIDTRSTTPQWEPEPRDIEAALAARRG